MVAKIIDGLAISKQIKQEIKEELQRCDYKPCLSVILCSDDPASVLYVKKKQAACEEVGIHSNVMTPFSIGIENYSDPLAYLLDYVKMVNEERYTHGVLVQLPLPHNLDQTAVFDALDPLKDVDVFSPTNVGLLLQGRPRFKPCTPAGIQEMLTHSGIQIAGKKVAIINRSDVVGKPLHALLVQNNDQANATCTLCHDHTPPDILKEVCLASDIIVVAVGIPNFLTADMVSEGAVVVDVGINRVQNSNRIVGDVAFEEVSKKAGWISKVPGGVGPMTVTMLLRNTLAAYKMQNGIDN